jgi:hypothetical protein
MNNDIICYTIRPYDRLFRLIRWFDGRMCCFSPFTWYGRALYRLSTKTTDRLLGLWDLTPICEPESVFYAKYPNAARRERRAA